MTASSFNCPLHTIDITLVMPTLTLWLADGATGKLNTLNQKGNINPFVLADN